MTYTNSPGGYVFESNVYMGYLSVEGLAKNNFGTLKAVEYEGFSYAWGVHDILEDKWLYNVNVKGGAISFGP